MSPTARFIDQLSAVLEALDLPSGGRRYAVACSGGLDSSVLLAAMVRAAGAPSVRAVHVDHQIHPDSADWAVHCERAAAALGVEYVGLRVRVSTDGGHGLEAAAREARYRAFEQILRPEEIMLTAHHADDQLETVLLRMLRGSGVRGLCGVLSCVRLGRGYVARPLLQWPRDFLREIAQAWQLVWLEDPANRDMRHDRNYLRAQVLPALRHRWPSAARTVGRLARQMAEADALLAEVATQDAAGLDAGPPRCAQLLALPAARRGNLLRWLIDRAGLAVPAAHQLAELDRALAVRRADAATRVQWPGAEARIYRGRLHLMTPLPPGSGAGRSFRVDAGTRWRGPEGQLRLAPADPDTGATLPGAWVETGLELRFRAGGERFRPAGSAHGRPLKDWLREAGIPPWMRTRIPLLFADGHLAAVGDLWVSADARARCADDACWRVVWTAHPPLE